MRWYVLSLSVLLCAMPASGAYTEFFVYTDGVGDQSDVNGGGPRYGAHGIPIYAVSASPGASIDSDGAGTTLTDNSGGAWAGVQADDWLCFAPAGAADLARVVSINSNQVTVTPAVTASQSDKGVNVAGAWATVAHAVATVSTTFVNASGDPPRINIGAGTWTFSSAIAPANNGTHAIPITIEGYTSTAGDAAVPVTTLDINGNDARVVYTTADHWQWRNLVFTGNAAYSKEGVRCYGGHNVFYRCRVTNVGGIGLSFWGTGCVAYGCEIDSWGQASTSSGMTRYANACSVIGCYLHDGTGPGITSVYPYGGGIIGTVIENCTDYGLRFTSSVGTAPNTVSHVVLYDNSSGGIYLDNAAGEANTPICLHDSLIISNGGYGITSNTGKGKVILLGTGFYNNTSGEIDGNTTVFEPVARVTLSGDPFLDAAGGDFRLKPETTELLGSGWPGAFLRNGQLTPWESYPDIGAVQQVVRPVINPMMGGP